MKKIKRLQKRSARKTLGACKEYLITTTVDAKNINNLDRDTQDKTQQMDI